MEPRAARSPILMPTTEAEVFLATNGWWPWLLLYAVLIGAFGAVIIHFVRQRRAKKSSAVTSSTAADVTPTAPPADAPEPPATPSDPEV